MSSMENYIGCCTGKIFYGVCPGFLENDTKEKRHLIMQRLAQNLHMNYYRDCSLITAISTEKQNQRGAIEYLTALGFKQVFSSDKKDPIQREKNTGGLTLWAVEPRDYEKGVKAFKEKYKADYNKPVGKAFKRSTNQFVRFTYRDFAANCPNFRYNRATGGQILRDVIQNPNLAVINGFLRRRYGYSPILRHNHHLWEIREYILGYQELYANRIR